MNTFRCSNCGFQMQRPTQPFSCPQCGRQAVGLFRVVAFTPPVQGPWPAQPVQPGMPQQPAWPQQPGVRQAFQPDQPAGTPQQPVMPQQPGMQPGMPQPVPGGWPAQPQSPQPPANLGTTAGACRRCRNRRLLEVGPGRPPCRNSRRFLSSPECHSRADGPRSRRCQPTPGNIRRACRRRRNRKCRRKAFPSRARRRNKACRRRRRPGQWHAATAGGAMVQAAGHPPIPSPQPLAPSSMGQPGIPSAPRVPAALSVATIPRDAAIIVGPTAAGSGTAAAGSGTTATARSGTTTAAATDAACSSASSLCRRQGPPDAPGRTAFSPPPGAAKRPALPRNRRPQNRRGPRSPPSGRGAGGERRQSGGERPSGEEDQSRPPPESKPTGGRTSAPSRAAQSSINGRGRCRRSRRRNPRPRLTVCRGRIGGRGTQPAQRRAGPATRKPGPRSGPASRSKYRGRPRAKPAARPKPARPESLIWCSRRSCFRKSRPLRFATPRPSTPTAAYSSSTGTARGPGGRRQEAEAALGVCYRQPCPGAGRTRPARYAPPALLRRLSALPRRGHRQAGLVAGRRRRAVGLCRAGGGSRRQYLGQFARRRLARVDSQGRIQKPPFFRSRHKFDSPAVVVDGVLDVGRESATCLPLTSAASAVRTSGTTRSIRATWGSSALRPSSRSRVIIVAGQDECLYGVVVDVRLETQLPGQILGSPVADRHSHLVPRPQPGPAGAWIRGACRFHRRQQS